MYGLQRKVYRYAAYQDARSGERRGLPACYEQVIGVCGNCTIHGDCLSIGANRFCPNQMNGLAA